MEAVNLKTRENIIGAYEFRPTLFYDVEGRLVDKDGKDIKIEKSLGGKNILYSLRTKEEVQGELNENIKVDKENILAMKIDQKEEKGPQSINHREIIKKMGLEDSQEVREGIDYLLDENIPISKENLEGFLMSKEYLREIIAKLDFNTSIQLMERGIDLKETSLQKISQALAEIKGEKKPLTLKDIVGFNKDLTYKDAERIARGIYGRRMGKDVYDTILALDRKGLAINKDRIDQLMEVTNKLYELKDYDSRLLINFYKENLTFNIDSLYKFKHSYTSKKMEENIASPLYESFTIVEDEGLNHILNSLEGLGLEKSRENIQLIREFILVGLEVSQENYLKLVGMKSKINELIELLDENKAAGLMEQGIDPLEEDIGQLVDRLKKPPGDIRVSEEARKLLEDIGDLKSLGDKDLAQLIKDGEDFKIQNLKNIIASPRSLEEGLNGKIGDKARTIIKIFNTLGELDSSTIFFAKKKFETISLDSLYRSHQDLEEGENIPVEAISQAEEGLIRQEYLNAKANTSLGLIRESIRDGLEIDHIPLDELNRYIDKKINKYRESQRLVNEIRNLKGRENFFLAKMIKNKLDMSLGQFKQMDDLFNKGKGIGQVFQDLVNNRGRYGEEVGQRLGITEERIRKLSQSIKEGKKDLREDYKATMESFKDLNNSSDLGSGEKEDEFKKLEDYINLQTQLSQDDLILQIPLYLGGKYRNINLIIPDIKRGINKARMSFYLNMDMDKLGLVKLKLKVEKENIYVEYKMDRPELAKAYENIFKEGLEDIGYGLENLEFNNKL